MNKTQLVTAMQTILQTSPRLVGEGETVDALAAEFATEELLTLMNAGVWPVYVANSAFSLARNVMHAETNGRSHTILPRVWPRPAVCVGETISIAGAHEDLIYEQNQETYVDDQGAVFLVLAYSVVIGGQTDLTIRQLSGESGPYSLNRIVEFLPERFSECVDL